MWILTLDHDESETHHVFRSGSSLKVGRSHEYRHDPNALYIGDLKVPKVYITLKVGRDDTGKPSSKSPLSIVFESRCTTKINGQVYKLASKDSDPFEKVFHEDELLLVVNANQSEKIKIRLAWVPVSLLVFSKRVQYDGIVQESPLVSRVAAMMAQGIDLRTTTDPTQASHYLTLSAYEDYNLHIAVSRAIPVLSEAWCDFVVENLNDVVNWLFEPKQSLYLQTENMFTFPEASRSKILESKTVAMALENAPPKSVARLKTWLTCLGAQNINVFDDANTARSQLMRGKDSLLFVANDKTESDFGTDVNSQTALWKAVVSNDASLLKHIRLEKLRDSEKRAPAETSSQPRRVRRKIERVSETDFFSFTPITSSLATNPPNLEPSLDASLFSSPEKTTVNKKISQLETPKAVPSDAADKTVASTKPSEIQQHVSADDNADLVFSDTMNDDTKESQPDPTATKNEDEKSITGESKDVNTGRFLPQKSFAEAVMSTKKSALSDMKHEDQEAPVDEKISSCKVETFQLEPKRTHGGQVSINPLYKDRKNFKAFKRKKTPNFVTRTYITLHDNENQVLFDASRVKSQTRLAKKRDSDFTNELPKIKGFQPQTSQLFVAEDDSDTESVEFSLKSQSLAQNPRSNKQAHDELGMVDGGGDDDDDDDDDEVAFTFSKRI